MPQLLPPRRLRGNLTGIRCITSEKPPQLSPRVDAPALPFGLIETAHAQSAAPSPQQPIVPNRRVSDEMRSLIMVLVFIVLGMTFILSIVAIFKTKNKEVLTWAVDTVKTLLGFFIGVATTLIGTS
jgi:hypothetical protein